MPSHIHAVADRPRFLAVCMVIQAIQMLTANTMNDAMSMSALPSPLEHSGGTKLASYFHEDLIPRGGAAIR
jgi:hypothetical protein